jgi:hypothetical protein
MADTKYGKYLIKAPLTVEEPSERKNQPTHKNLVFMGKEKCGVDIAIMLVPVSVPHTMLDAPHKHDFPQFLCFLGSDPDDLGNLGAEIEVSLGEEGGKHTITEPTILYNAPGLVHGPLVYKKVDRPVMHLDIVLTHEYVRKGVSGKEIVRKSLVQ